MILNDYIIHKLKVQGQGTNYGIHVCYLTDFQFYNFWYTDK